MDSKPYRTPRSTGTGDSAMKQVCSPISGNSDSGLTTRQVALQLQLAQIGQGFVLRPLGHCGTRYAEELRERGVGLEPEGGFCGAFRKGGVHRRTTLSALNSHVKPSEATRC
jgi:hypothetical protein